MKKVIQVQTSVLGDNVTAEQGIVTTILYDDGSMYEGSQERIGGNHNDGYKYGWVWNNVDLSE